MDRIRYIKTRIFLSTLFSLITLIIVASIAISLGSAKISIIEVYKILFGKIPLIRNLVHMGDEKSINSFILLNIRLPRVIAAIIVGMALAGSGVMYQGIFKNPMADSYIVGISPGALLGSTIAIILGIEVNFFGLSTIVFFSFLGALVISFLIFNLTNLTRTNTSVLTIILAGLAIGALCNAFSSFLKIIASQEQLHQLVFWIMGSFASPSWLKVVFATPVILVGIVILFFFTKDLNVFSLGEERAKQLGINVTFVKNVILYTTSLIVGAAVSISGLIAFVGIIVPHITRLIVGSDNRRLYPVSVIFGGILMLLADTVARTLINPREIPVGIITSLLGSPFFIWLLFKSKKKVEF